MSLHPYCFVLSKVTHPFIPAPARIIMKILTKAKSVVTEPIVTGQIKGSSVRIFFSATTPINEIINGIRYISTMIDTKHENTVFTV